jgi:hypothetical protein
VIGGVFSVDDVAEAHAHGRSSVDRPDHRRDLIASQDPPLLSARTRNAFLAKNALEMVAERLEYPYATRTIGLRTAVCW